MKYAASPHLLLLLTPFALSWSLLAQQPLAPQQHIADAIPSGTETPAVQDDTECQECNAQTHQTRAAHMFEQGYLTEASAQYNAALAIYEALEQPDAAALCLAGMLRCHTTLPHGKALAPTAHKALAYTRQSHDKVVVATLLASMGNYYHAMQDFPRAESCFLQALPVLRGQKQPSAKGLYAATLADMAAVQAHNQHFEDAMAACNKALRIARKHHLPNEQAHVHAQMAEIYLIQGNVGQAYSYLNRAIAADSTAGKLANVAELYLRKGDLLILMGQPQTALMRYGETVQLAKTLQINPLLSIAYTKLADTHTLMHHSNQAKVYTKLRQQIDATMQVAVE